jgi:hypothetical protein
VRIETLNNGGNVAVGGLYPAKFAQNQEDDGDSSNFGGPFRASSQGEPGDILIDDTKIEKYMEGGQSS